jgi:hypothetical protein
VTLILLDEAIAEAKRDSEWYDDKRQGLGDEFLEDLERTLARLVASPLSFPRYEARRIRAEVRRILCERFSHAVIFQLAHDAIYVLSICHTSRRPAYWRKRVVE